MVRIVLAAFGQLLKIVPAGLGGVDIGDKLQIALMTARTVSPRAGNEYYLPITQTKMRK